MAMKMQLIKTAHAVDAMKLALHTENAIVSNKGLLFPMMRLTHL
jgi:hypothetical protein